MKGRACQAVCSPFHRCGLEREMISPCGAVNPGWRGLEGLEGDGRSWRGLVRAGRPAFPSPVFLVLLEAGGPSPLQGSTRAYSGCCPLFPCFSCHLGLLFSPLPVHTLPSKPHPVSTSSKKPMETTAPKNFSEFLLLTALGCVQGHSICPLNATYVNSLPPSLHMDLDPLLPASHPGLHMLRVASRMF